MHNIAYRLVERNFNSRAGFIAAVQRNALAMAQGSSPSVGTALLGCWVDGDGQGVSMRILREGELSSGQVWTWRPLRAFPLDRVASEGVEWLAQRIRGEA